jgi:hypothetical protein
VTFGIHNELALVPLRLLERLPDVARQRHVAALETANEALTAAGLPALRSPLPTTERAAERPGADAPAVAADRPSRLGQRALHAVAAIARLDAGASASTPPPELSL